MFATCDAAKTAYEAKASVSLGGANFTAKLKKSANVADHENIYCPNVFDDAAEAFPRVHRAPIPKWFVAYYRDGHSNFIHAIRYLEREIRVIPEGQLKRYGKCVLIRAKYQTQAMMLIHYPCPSDGKFESIKPHLTFNYCKGRAYNQDLYAFSEEDILSVCPDYVQRVTKVKGSNNMLVFTCHGNYLPGRIKVGPLTITLRYFVDRPLQC